MILTTIQNLEKEDKRGKESEDDDVGLTNQQYTVFLVEDDIDDQHLAVQTLKKSPYIYNVHCFENGEKLEHYLASEGYYSGNMLQNLPVLIILDIHMPGTSGLETLKKIKEHPLTEDIPVIILTGDLSNKTALDAYRSHANAFIVKPLNLEHVHDVIYTGWGWPGRHKG